MADMHFNQPVPIAGTATASGSNVAGLIFPSASRAAAAYNSDELFNPNCKGVRLYIDMTNVGAGPGTVVAKIQGRDPVTDTWVDITGATTAALNAVQTKTLTVYPGITAAAGAAGVSTEVSSFVPTSWRVVATVATNAVTFSIGAEYLL